MIRRLLQSLFGADRYGVKRSSGWGTVRKDWIKAHPICRGCGGIEELEAHHKIAFHERPNLELDPHNLITLCEKHHCHLRLGHSWNWQTTNPHVEADCLAEMARLQHARNP